jgi:hypothetical protein
MAMSFRIPICAEQLLKYFLKLFFEQDVSTPYAYIAQGSLFFQ